MTPNTTHKILMILLGIAAVCVTLLVALSAISRTGTGDTRGGTEPVAINIPVPPFTLTDQNGQPFGSEQLAGKVYIVDFIFTRCPGPCPAMTAAMADIQNKLKNHPQWNDIRLLSISVDPDHDTPAVLAEYASMYGADDEHWRLLTGDRAEVWQLVTRGFMQQLSAESDDSSHAIAHTQKFILVDRDGHMRGQFDGIDHLLPNDEVLPHERAQLLEALDRLLAQ